MPHPEAPTPWVANFIFDVPHVGSHAGGPWSLNILWKVNWIAGQKVLHVDGIKNRLGRNEGAGIFSSNKWSRECKKSESDEEGDQTILSLAPLILLTIWNQSFVSMWPCNIKENMSTGLRLVRCFVIPRQKVSKNCSTLIVKNVFFPDYSAVAKTSCIPASL